MKFIAFYEIREYNVLVDSLRKSCQKFIANLGASPYNNALTQKKLGTKDGTIIFAH